MDYLKIRNWEKWQSYRQDRGQPPWIKIHRRLMRNPEWVELTDAERGQLVAIWLLAADHNGVIPASPDLIQKLCFMSEQPNLNRLTELGFISSNGSQPDANLTSARRQLVTPKAKAEENRIEKNKSKASLASNQNQKRLLQDLNAKCLTIKSLPTKQEKFNPHQWIQYAINHRYHPEAISHTLDSLISNWDGISTPWIYANKIISVESGNYYERDGNKSEEKYKADFISLANDMKALRNL